MTAKTSRERIAAERLMWGDVLGAMPGLQDLAANTRADFGAGLSQDQVRQRLRSRLEGLGLTSRRMVLPSVTRKMLRLSLRKLLHELADLLVARAPGRKFGEALDPLLAKLGWDRWLEDYIYTYATSGETSPIYASFTGAVIAHEFGPKDEKTPAVVLVATPASDVRALVEEFIERCYEELPTETFDKRFDSMYEGAKYRRLHAEGVKFSAIATENVRAERPDLEPGSAQFRELVKMETERVAKAAERSSRRADRIADFLSADSG